MKMPELALPADVPLGRLDDRRALLRLLDRRLASAAPADKHSERALDLLGAPAARAAFDPGPRAVEAARQLRAQPISARAACWHAGWSRAASAWHR